MKILPLLYLNNIKNKIVSIAYTGHGRLSPCRSVVRSFDRLRGRDRYRDRIYVPRGRTSGQENPGKIHSCYSPRYRISFWFSKSREIGLVR